MDKEQLDLTSKHIATTTEPVNPEEILAKFTLYMTQIRDDARAISDDLKEVIAMITEKQQ